MAQFRMGNTKARRLPIRSHAEPCRPSGTGKRMAVIICCVGSTADLPGPKQSWVTGCQVRPPLSAISASASSATKATLPSAAGRALTRLPASVATVCIWSAPTVAAASGSTRACCFSRGESLIWRNVTLGPRRIQLSCCWIRSKPGMRVTSTRHTTLCLPSCNSIMRSVPPAMTWACPSYRARVSSASATEVGISYACHITCLSVVVESGLQDNTTTNGCQPTIARRYAGRSILCINQIPAPGRRSWGTRSPTRRAEPESPWGARPRAAGCFVGWQPGPCPQPCRYAGL